MRLRQRLSNQGTMSEEEQKQLLEEFMKQEFQVVELSESGSGQDSTGAATTVEGWNGNPEAEEPQKPQNRAKKHPEIQEDDEAAGKIAPDFMADFRNPEACEVAEGTGTVTYDHDSGEDDYLDMAKDMQRILNDMAEAEYQKEVEKEISRSLQEEVKQIDFGEIHKNCTIKVHRARTVPQNVTDDYKEIYPEIRKVSVRLQQSVEELLIKKEGGRLSGLYSGKHLSKGALYRQDGKIFEKRILPEEDFSIAFAVLVDNSWSMTEHDRILYAKTASLILHDFCKSLSIPVAVYGHTTSYPDSYFSEVVDLFAYTEFDSEDGKDGYRIMSMVPGDSNRDGAALRFVGERLLKRSEDIRILVLVSDGNPCANGYGGEPAKADLSAIKRELQKKGVLLFAAAIGDDKEQIESIYGDGFLNISNLKSMPVKLAQLLMQYMK